MEPDSYSIVSLLLLKSKDAPVVVYVQAEQVIAMSSAQLNIALD